MNCPEVGLLRAYADDELSPAERSSLNEHLATCGDCSQALARLSAEAEEVRLALDSLAPAPRETTPPAVALRAFRERERSRAGLWQRLQEGVLVQMSAFSTRWRVAVASMATLFLALVLVATPAGSAVAGWLSVFRAEKFAPVTIDPAATRTADVKLNPEDFGTIQVDQEPTFSEVADPTTANVGFAVRQPAFIPERFNQKAKAAASTPGEMVFVFDRAKSQAAFASMGVQVDLPPSVEGAVARLYVPAGVHMSWTGPEGSKSGLMLAQAPSPTVELPGFLESKATRELFYSLAGLPPELAAQLDAFVESGDTAPVPVLKGDQASQVAVDGTQGVLVSHAPAIAGSDAPEGSYLVWQKGGVVYALGGTVSTDELVQVANSLR